MYVSLTYFWNDLVPIFAPTMIANIITFISIKRSDIVSLYTRKQNKVGTKFYSNQTDNIARTYKMLYIDKRVLAINL